MEIHTERLAAANDALEGLSVGDAIGEALSYRFYEARENCDFSVFRDGTVCYTDDTEMALAIVDLLRRTRSVDEDLLAWAFASRFRKDPDRGYGKMARRILNEIAAGTPWEKVSKNAFGGGSFGNGAAMRVAPLGAYFADELDSIPEIATKSARVTHYHPEGINGAVAIAISSAAAFNARGQGAQKASDSIWQAALQYTSPGKVRDGIALAESIKSVSAAEAARELGNGAEISAQDTVPFCLWNACRCIENFEEAIISTIEVGGDCDTNSAIVGGIVASFTGKENIPEEWVRVRERFD